MSWVNLHEKLTRNLVASMDAVIPLGRVPLGMRNGMQTEILKENAKSGVMEAEVVQGARGEIQLSVMPGKTLVGLVANMKRNIPQEMEMAGIIIRNRKATEKREVLEMIAGQTNGARLLLASPMPQKNNESLRGKLLEIVSLQMLLCEMLDLREKLLKKMDGVLRKVDGVMLNQNRHGKCGLRVKEMIESLPLITEMCQHMVAMDGMEEMPQPKEEIPLIAGQHRKRTKKVGGTTIMQENPCGSKKVTNGEKAAN